MTRAPRKHPIRENLEAFGVAILVAVLWKPLILEAYSIPTSSMQPTLMGSSSAGVYDRLIVDKLRYELFEPARWDVAVFRYPIRQNQNYVKRIVGMPGDRLRIAGGNVYQVAADGSMTALRKPPSLQRNLWKEIYPARRWLQEGTGPLDGWWRGQGWSADGDALVVDATRQAALTYDGRSRFGGLLNRVFDGYPTGIARAMLDESVGGTDRAGVHDLRLQCTLIPEQSPQRFAIELDVTSSGRARRFQLVVEDGKGKLAVLVNGKQELASPPFDVALPGGEETTITFARLDDDLIASVDGEEQMRLAADAHQVTVDLEGGQQPSISLLIAGAGRCRVEDLRLERDLHYTRYDLPADHLIEVPPANYLMLGDNTLQSVDSRGWTALEVARTPDGRLVDPRAEPAAQKLLGNLRPRSPAGPVDADENPVVLRGRDTVVFTDLPGEVHRLRTPIGASYERAPLNGEPHVAFGPSGEEWVPQTRKIMFVPREHILGRPVLVFWPTWPFAPANRIGFVR